MQGDPSLFPAPETHDPGGKVTLGLLPGVYGAAQISDCGRYRQGLYRWWTGGDAFRAFEGDYLLWIGMNPSTAGPFVDDPTVRKWQAFTRREGLGAMAVCNVMDWRATDPRALLDLDAPCSPDNVPLIVRGAQRATKVIASWGVVHPKLAHHYDALLSALDGIPLWCLGTTKAGHPRHPLYVRGDTPLVPFNH